MSLTKVLVVDDDKESRDLLCEVLTTHQYEAGAVESVAAAVAELNRDAGYSIVVADLRMPNGTGLDLLQHVRRSASRQDVVLMSSFISGTEKERALELGADALLEKPFRLAELLKVVSNLAERRPREVENLAGRV